MRVRWIFAIGAAIVATLVPGAAAGDTWRIVDTAGVVRVGGPGLAPVAFSREQALPADAWIETASGRVVLRRGLETVVVEPNSRIQLPSAAVNGNTQVLQDIGSAIYKIGKQRKPHFQVDTPYMAALVKGTAFTVTVGDGEATVAVTEGLVQVLTPDEGDAEFVRPGFTAYVSRDGGEIQIDRSRGGAEQRDLGPPNKEKGGTQAILIPAAIGDVELDIKKASGGLSSGDTESIDAGADGGRLSPSEDGRMLKDGASMTVERTTEEALAPVDVGPIIATDAPVDAGPVVGIIDGVESTVDGIRSIGTSTLGQIAE